MNFFKVTVTLLHLQCKKDDLKSVVPFYLANSKYPWIKGHSRDSLHRPLQKKRALKDAILISRLQQPQDKRGRTGRDLLYDHGQNWTRDRWPLGEICFCSIQTSGTEIQWGVACFSSDLHKRGADVAGRWPWKENYAAAATRGEWRRRRPRTCGHHQGHTPWGKRRLGRRDP